MNIQFKSNQEARAIAARNIRNKVCSCKIGQKKSEDNDTLPHRYLCSICGEYCTMYDKKQRSRLK